jgi:acyl carrier protein
MKDQVYEFVASTLVAMNYDVDEMTDRSTLGPSGLDLESLAIAELGVRVEDKFGIKFNDEESDELASMTVGEFCDLVASRAPAAA